MDRHGQSQGEQHAAYDAEGGVHPGVAMSHDITGAMETLEVGACVAIDLADRRYRILWE